MISILRKNKSYLYTFLLVLGMCFSVSLIAATPEKTLGFQGQLYDGGTAKTGSVNATFTFYDALTDGGVTGSTIAKTITVSNGYFGTTFSEADTTGVDFNQQLFLEVTINGTTLSPRTSVNPNVSSLKTFGTFSYSSAPTVGPIGSLYFNSTTNELYVSQGSTWQLAGLASSTTQWSANGTSLSYMAGNVGIGTTTPNFSLTVAGQVNILGGSGSSSVLMSDVDLSTSTRGSGNNIFIGAAQFPNGGTLNSIILGKGAYTGGGSNDYNNVVIGRSASVVSLTDPNGVPNAVVIGGSAKSYYGGVIVIGRGAEARGNLSIAIGEVAIASSTNAIVVGRVSTVSGTSSATFGGGNTVTQENAYVYGHTIGTTGGGTVHGFGTLNPTDTSRMTIRSRYSTSSSLTLLSNRMAITNGLILGGIEFKSDDSDLTAGGITTASIQSIANQTHTASQLGTDLAFYTTSGTTSIAAMRVLGNGNVGIGTTTPTSKLHVEGAFTISSSSELFTTTLGSVAGAPGQPFFQSSRGYYIFKPLTTAAARMYVMPNGAVSGTTAKFEIFNTDYITDGTNYSGFNIFTNNVTNEINIGANKNGSSTRLKMIIGGDYTSSSLSGTSPKIEFNTDNTINITASSTKILGGTSGFGLTVVPTGYVSVGSDTPASKLSVYENNTGTGNTNGLTLEQAGSGDALAHFIITGAQRYTVGIDNSDGDKFKIGTNSDLGTNNLLTLTNLGNLGIGTTTPSQILVASGTIQSTALLGGITTLSVDASGNIIRTPSDSKLKTNVETITSALEKVNQIRGVSYNWLDTSRFGPDKEIGFIAQELETIVPEVVKSGGEYKSVNYQNLVALLVEAIKELNGKVNGFAENFKSKKIESELVESKTVRTDKLCVKKSNGSEICLTGDQVEQVLSSQNIQSAPVPNNTPAEPTPEVVSAEQPVIELEPTPEPLPEPVTPPTEPTE